MPRVNFHECLTRPKGNLDVTRYISMGHIAQQQQGFIIRPVPDDDVVLENVVEHRYWGRAVGTDASMVR